ncbi:MAG: hypothetical protein IV085_04580 [Thiobacillus sp.]|nr:hypothetical protein [Thiobacillus sp.]
MHTIHTVLFALGTLGVADTASATPIVFTQTTYTSFALADAGEISDGPNSGISLAGQPLSSAAEAANPDGDLASAVVFADQLVLATTSEASAQLGVASANAVGTFSGRFDAVPGQLDLSFNFDNFLTTLADGIASSTLAVTLTVDNITLVDALITDPILFNQQFVLTSGGAGLFDLSLIGSSFASPGSSAFTLATVNAALEATAFAVSEPGGIGLLLAGVLGLAGIRRKPGLV